jgi:hypothetical protein
VWSSVGEEQVAGEIPRSFKLWRRLAGGAGRQTPRRTILLAVLMLALASAPVVGSALATHRQSASNAHTPSGTGTYHGIYTEHMGAGTTGWYFHAWTDHGHGGEKLAWVAHSGGADHSFHCQVGPGSGDASGHLHCSPSRYIGTSHHSSHDAKIDTTSSCKKYSDGHGICFHNHNGPFQ